MTPIKYDDAYIRFGFIAIETNRDTRPQCAISAAVFSNDTLKSAKLEQNEVLWEKLAGFRTAGAPTMFGSRSGLATLVKGKKPFSIVIHVIDYTKIN